MLSLPSRLFAFLLFRSRFISAGAWHRYIGGVMHEGLAARKKIWRGVDVKGAGKWVCRPPPRRDLHGHSHHLAGLQGGGGRAPRGQVARMLGMAGTSPAREEENGFYNRLRPPPLAPCQSVG